MRGSCCCCCCWYCYNLVTLFQIRCSFCRIRFVDSKYFHATAPSGELGNGQSCNRVAYAHRYRATKSNCVYFTAVCVYFSIFVFIAFKQENVSPILIPLSLSLLQMIKIMQLCFTRNIGTILHQFVCDNFMPGKMN